MAEGGQCNSALANDNTFCQPCKDEGELKEAHGYCQNCQEYMCQDCIKSIHRSSKTKGHTILSGEQMPSTPPERDDQGSTEEYSEMCKVHTNEVLKFFCPDHEVFECGICIVLHHRACSVQFVPDAAKGFSNTSEYKDQRNMLGAIQNDIQTCEDKVEERSISANEAQSIALGNLKKFRKKINEYLDETEKDIESFAEQLKARVDEKIEELKNKYVEIKGRADKSEQILDTASSDEVRLFMTSKRSGKDIEVLKRSVDKLKKTCEEDNMRYEFKPDSVFEKILNLKRNLGKMTVTNEAENDDERNDNEDELYLNEDENDQSEGDHIASENTTFGQASIEDISVIDDNDVLKELRTCSFNCRVFNCSDVKHPCLQHSSVCISGMAVLSPGRLVVADSECNSVKLVDTSNSKVLARYSTASYPSQGQQPFDVTVVSNEKIAVTYDGNSLRILSTENNTLAELCCVPIPTPGYISYINYQFYLLSGSLISVRDDKIKDAQNSKFEFKGNLCERKPAFNTSDGNVLYVPDKAGWDTYTLRKVSLDGTILATYTDWQFRMPGVVTSVGDGTILLFNRDNQELLLMSENCEKIRSLLKFKNEDGIKNIMAMVFCSETKTLFMGGADKSKTIKAVHFT